MDEVRMFKALADRNRLNVFRMLLNGETCACKILEQLDISQPTLSRHMRVLVDSGLVTVRRDAQWMRYSVNPEAVRQLSCFFNEIAL